ncbi:branched-chain amino acid ABC transporter permease [Halobacteriales archaeon QS_4_69_225]|nr:MAG: branched-chain amino acid ABC transporter permease [Halobacteriales archaeon QS_4_69_225]
MGVADGYRTRAEGLVENPFNGLLVFIGLYLVADLILKLSGVDVVVNVPGMGATKIMGGVEPLDSFLSKVINGILRGLIIGLAGIGLSMTYSILGFANFAHGDFITVGAFMGVMTSYIVAGVVGAATYDIGTLALMKVEASQLGLAITGGPLAFAAIVLGLLIAGVGTVGVVLLVDRLAFEPIRDRSSVSLLITSIGVALVIRYLVNFIWGIEKFSANSPGDTWELAIRGSEPANGLQRGPSTWEFVITELTGSIRVNAHDFTLLIIAVSLMLGVHVLLQTSKLGKAMRAMADNKDLARVTGIPTDRVIRFTWVLGGSLTGVAGYTWVLWSGTFGWYDGWLFLLLVFAAVILGGIGSIYGAMAGGLIIGLARDLSIIFIPSAFAKAFAFALMIVVLVVKPSGLFAGRTTA